jgi:hypothetical protein
MPRAGMEQLLKRLATIRVDNTGYFIETGDMFFVIQEQLVAIVQAQRGVNTAHFDNYQTCSALG